MATVHADLATFETLVSRWKTTVCSIALAILKDVAESEDVAQEVFITAWTKLSTLDNLRSFGPWVRQITRNHALARRRAQLRREARVVSDTEATERHGQEDTHLAEEERRLVQEALDQLPDDARDVMILFYREGQSVQQVAELLDLSQAAVKKRLSRARAQIRTEVMGRLESVLVATAPGAAFTLGVLALLAPAPAVAATAAMAAGSKLGGVTLSTMGLGALIAVVLGYKLAESVTREEHIHVLHRARNLTVVGVFLMLLGGALGPAPAAAALCVFIGLLGYVQFRVLPRAFAGPGGVPHGTQAERLGRFCGVVGFGIGSLCGLLGASHGLGWW